MSDIFHIYVNILKSLLIWLILQITVCDISQNMLDVGQSRAAKLNYKGIEWVCGDAQKLPFPDDEFDGYTIAFGIRNVVDIQKVSINVEYRHSIADKLKEIQY